MMVTAESWRSHFKLGEQQEPQGGVGGCRINRYGVSREVWKFLSLLDWTQTLFQR